MRLDPVHHKETTARKTQPDGTHTVSHTLERKPMLDALKQSSFRGHEKDHPNHPDRRTGNREHPHRDMAKLRHAIVMGNINAPRGRHDGESPFSSPPKVTNPFTSDFPTSPGSFNPEARLDSGMIDDRRPVKGTMGKFITDYRTLMDKMDSMSDPWIGRPAPRYDDRPMAQGTSVWGEFGNVDNVPDETGNVWVPQHMRRMKR